jgi:mannosyltransferase
MPKWASRLTLTLVLVLALGLRFYRLDAQSLWSDEGNSARLAERSLPLITVAAAADIHPPLYYYLLHFWAQALGTSELALRALSALAGLALVALVFLIGQALFGRRVGLIAAALAAVNPFQVYYSQEARMYMLAAMLGTASTFCFVRWLKERETERGGYGWAAATALLTAAGLYTHYAYPLIPAAQTAAVLIWLWEWRDGRARTALVWAGILAAALALYLPWLPIAYRQLTTWPSARLPVTSLEAALVALHLLVLGQTLPTENHIFSLALVLWLGLSLGLFQFARRPLPVARRLFPLALVLAWLIVPLAFVLLAGLFQGPFLKFLLIASPPLCLLIGVGMMGWARLEGAPSGHRSISAPSLTPRRVVGGLAALLMLAWLTYDTATSLRNLYFDPAYARDDYRGIAADIRALQREGDGIILNAPNQWEVFTYYYRDGLPVYPVARDRPLDEAAEARELNDILARHRRLFALYWGDRESDPQRFVERWLSTHAYPAQDVWRGNVRFVIYGVPAQAQAENPTPLGMRFGPHIRLESYSLASRRLRPGDVLALTLTWATDAPLADRVKVFVHLYDAGEHILAQHDSEPGAGLQPTTTWAPGEAIRDHHGVLIPIEAAPGTYRLAIGLYRPDGSRLTLEDGADRLFLGGVTIEGEP